MSESMARMAAAAGVDAVNVWGTLLRQMEGHLEMPSMNLPMIKRPIRSSGSTNSMSSASVSAALLSSDYYRMIEAVEYTRQCDDGASSAKWKEADILILGISRTGKTPLSIFLGQRGYKVANLPLVPVNGELRIPSYIADVDPNRIFGLKISPDVLHAIRAHRLRTMGVTEAESQAKSDATGVSNRAASRRSSYSDLSVVRQELDLAEALFRRNPTWKVLDVTHKGVEETAARIMAVMTERFGARPRVSLLRVSVSILTHHSLRKAHTRVTPNNSSSLYTHIQMSEFHYLSRHVKTVNARRAPRAPDSRAPCSAASPDARCVARAERREARLARRAPRRVARSRAPRRPARDLAFEASRNSAAATTRATPLDARRRDGRDD